LADSEDTMLLDPTKSARSDSGALSVFEEALSKYANDSLHRKNVCS